MITSSLVSRNVVYENVWLAESDGRHFKGVSGYGLPGIPVSAKLGGRTGWPGTWLTCTWRDGKLVKITYEKGQVKRQGAVRDRGCH